jgi:hypothetical protein
MATADILKELHAIKESLLLYRIQNLMKQEFALHDQLLES